MSNFLTKNPPIPKIIGTKHADIKYTERHAIRVITLNEANQIALIHAEKDDYYKLPGGGIEGTEEHTAAAAREVREETGATISIRSTVGCIAVTEEYRNDLHQFSYAYIADVLDASGEADLTAEEQADGLSHPEWLSAGDALAKMRAVQPRSELGLFIQERDVYLLGEAIRVLEI